MAAIVKTRKAPFSSCQLSIAPVDYVVDTILSIVEKRNETLFGQSFHIICSNFIKRIDVVEAIRSCGYTIDAVDESTWLNQFSVTSDLHKKSASGSVPLIGILQQHGIPKFNDSERFRDVNCLKALQDANSKVVCPSISCEIVSNFIQFYKAKGMLE